MNETSPRPGADELTAVVLGGGYSRRFGERDKALARVGGRPLLERVVDRLGVVADRVIVNCRDDQRDAFAEALDATRVPTTFATDPVPDRGPLAGFRTALDEVGTDTCALAACDTPFLDPRTVADLVDRIDDAKVADAELDDGDSVNDADAVGMRADDGDQPMPAVYRTGPAADACDALLDADDSRLSALFDSLDSRAVPVDDVSGNAAASLFDVDAPADRERAVELLDAEGGSLTRLAAPRREQARPQ